MLVKRKDDAYIDFQSAAEVFYFTKIASFFYYSTTTSPRRDDARRIYENKKRSIYYKSDCSSFHTKFYHANDRNKMKIIIKQQY